MDWGAEPAQRYDANGTTGLIWIPAPGVVVTRIAGHGSLGVTRFYVAAAQRAIVEFGRVRVFHDWSAIDGYDPEARKLLRAFGVTNTDERVLVRYLLASKILSMAVQTAGLVLRRDFESTTDPAVFERWVDAGIAEARQQRGGRGLT